MFQIDLKIGLVRKQELMDNQCKIKGCTKSAAKLFCNTHLNDESIDMVTFTDEIKATPSRFVSNKTEKMKEVNVFSSTSPLKMKRSTRKARKVKASIQKSIDHKRLTLDVVYSSKTEAGVKNCFYAPTASMAENMQKVDSNQWKNSSQFEDYSMKPSRHQIFIDEESNEVVFFIPSLEWQRHVFSDQV